MERNETYANKLALAFEKVGHKTKYKEVIQLNINKFKVRGLDKTITINESTDGRFKRTKKTFVDIYLPNTHEKYAREGKDFLSTAEKKILAMFISKKSIAEKLIKGDEMLMDFIKKLQQLNDDEGLLRSYDHELVDREEAKKAGRREGRREGKREGKKESMREGMIETQKLVAQKMIQEGLPLDLISKCTTMSKKQINDLIEIA